jgi:hypothetical protein
VLAANDHDGEPDGEADCADLIRKPCLNCQSRDIATPRSPRSELTGWMSSRAIRSRRTAPTHAPTPGHPPMLCYDAA